MTATGVTLGFPVLPVLCHGAWSPSQNRKVTMWWEGRPWREDRAGKEWEVILASEWLEAAYFCENGSWRVKFLLLWATETNHLIHCGIMYTKSLSKGRSPLGHLVMEGPLFAVLNIRAPGSWDFNILDFHYQSLGSWASDHWFHDSKGFSCSPVYSSRLWNYLVSKIVRAEFWNKSPLLFIFPSFFHLTSLHPSLW